MQLQFNDLYAANVHAVKRMAKLNSRVWNRTSDEQLNLLRACTECGQRQLGLWSGGNGAPRPADFLAAEADIFKELTGQVVEYSRIVAANAHDAAGETMSCIEEFFEPLRQSQNGNGDEAESQKVTRQKRSAA